MRLVVSTTGGENWNQWVRQLDGNLFHSQEWASTQCSDTSCPVFFQWRNNDGRCLGIAVGVKSWSPRRWVGKYLRQLSFETLPAALDDRPDLTQVMIDQLISYARKQNYRKIDLQSFMSKTNIRELGVMGLSTSGRIEFVIDLHKSDEEIFSDFSSHHRRKIKKAKKHAMDLYEASSMEALREFRKLQVMSRDRRIKRGEDIGILDDTYYEILGKNYFANQLGRIFIMRSEGRPLSAAFVSIYGQRALYMYGGSSDEGFNKDAPVLLFQHIFRRCRELGCVEFNLGGVPAESVNKDAPSFGLYRFKSGFGGHQVACTNGYNHHLISAENCLFQISNLLKKQRRRLWTKES